MAALTVKCAAAGAVSRAGADRDGRSSGAGDGSLGVNHPLRYRQWRRRPQRICVMMCTGHNFRCSLVP